MHDLGTLPDRTGSGKALGISSDGDVIVGQFDFEAFRWTAAGGMVGISSPPRLRATSVANDVSSDGNRIVGWVWTDDGNKEAFLWTPEDGMRPLELILGVDEGLDLAGVELLDATSISDDGRVIAGSGRRDGLHVTWIADLGEVSRPDTPTELPNARGPWQFFSITRDARRCISPLCGGWWVRAVNEALTRCADGSWAEACYVAALDTSRVGGDLAEFDNSLNNLAFGRVKRQKYRGFGNLGELVVTDAWYGAASHGSSTEFGPEWSAVWDNGIRCVTFPCNSTGQEFLNTGATGRLSILDLSAVDLDQAERNLAQWLLANDLLLVAGRNVRFINRGPVDDGFALIANQIYLPLAGGEGERVED
jgi:probable HAF family extracellular repeat protein